jgi:hypothetical protein
VGSKRAQHCAESRIRAKTTETQVGAHLNTFRHSGKLGDIIYSLPAVRALGGGTFYVDAATEYFKKPPLGREAAQMMVDLLETQEYIHGAAVFSGEPVTCDLDRFRDKAVPVHFFNIFNSQTDKLAGLLFGNGVQALRRTIVPGLEVDLPQYHWEAAGLPGTVDLSTPWIQGIEGKPLAEIVISKTSRHPGTLDWLALKKHASHSVFVGLAEEWQAFRETYFDLDFYRVSNLLEFAQVVAGAKLYVGNQSFGLALAEAMLVPRIAELWESSPNRMPAIRGHHVVTPEVVEAYIHHD